MSDHGTDCVCAECFPKKLRFPFTIAEAGTKPLPGGFTAAWERFRLAEQCRAAETAVVRFFNAYNASRLTWTRGI